MIETYLPLIFLVIAMIYSSVGFGGGSSYLAILSLLVSEYYQIRTTALILNLVVVSYNVISQQRAKSIDWKGSWPFLILSIPAAYLGAQFRMSQEAFFMILGGALMLSSVFMFIQVFLTFVKRSEISAWQSLSVGALVGLLSGVTGIGGGIYLSPVLNLIGWRNAKVIAALASVFILANSVSGLVGLTLAGTLDTGLPNLLLLLLAVIVGAVLGGYIRETRLKPRVVKLLTALLVGYVGLRLLLRYAFEVYI